jgi:Arc/MetJ family transcription regulator
VEIRAAAGRRRVTVSVWVRLVLRDGRDRGLSGPMRGEALGSSHGEVETPGRVAVHEPASTNVDSSTPLGRRERIDVEVGEGLIEAVCARYHLPSARAAIEFALRRVAVRPMSKEEALAMEGAGWDGDLEALRGVDPGDLW